MRDKFMVGAILVLAVGCGGEPVSDEELAGETGEADETLVGADTAALYNNCGCECTYDLSHECSRNVDGVVMTGHVNGTGTCQCKSGAPFYNTCGCTIGGVAYPGTSLRELRQSVGQDQN